MSNVLSDWENFPRIGLVVEGKKKFYTLSEAISLWDSGLLKVEDTGEILEEDFSVRNMTQEESCEFQRKTDEYSGSKK